MTFGANALALVTRAVLNGEGTRGTWEKIKQLSLRTGDNTLCQEALCLTSLTAHTAPVPEWS